MKKLLLTAFSTALIASAPLAPAQLSPTDRLALNSGMSLWLASWNSMHAESKLEPLYRADVVTRMSSASGVTLRSWKEFLAVIRERRIAVASAVENPADKPTIATEGERAVTSLPSGVRLVWEKNSGVWKIVEQNLPEEAVQAVAVAADK